MRRAARTWPALLWCALVLWSVPGVVGAEPGRGDTLRIGTSGSLASFTGSSQEDATMQALRDFIKAETDMDNEIVRQKDWQELTAKMSQRKLDLAVLQGYELAWAQEKDPGLKALALAVNVYRYPKAYIVTRRDGPSDLAGLRGKTIDIPARGGGYVQLFLDRQCEKQGQAADRFFAHVRHSDNSEDALDDLVDGKVQAVAANQTALAAFKRRKPSRFRELKELVHSQPFPPTVVACQEGVLDQDRLHRFRDGLLRARQSDRGQTLLNYFGLTGFEAAPADLDRVLAEIRRAYPPPGAGAERAKSR